MTIRRPRPLPANSRKLLVAAMGIAAVSYVGCSDNKHPVSGNLMAREPDAAAEVGQFPTSGNLMAPDATVGDAADGAAVDAADAGDAGDAADPDADAS